MSAWIVSYNHINSLVDFAVEYNLIPDLTEDQLGQLLWKENYKSVNYRYNEQEKCPLFIWKPSLVKNISLVQIIKLCDCLDYQSCEHDDYKVSEAYNYITLISTKAKNLLGDQINKDQYNQEYNYASWGID